MGNNTQAVGTFGRTTWLGVLFFHLIGVLGLEPVSFFYSIRGGKDLLFVRKMIEFYIIIWHSSGKYYLNRQ